MNIPKEVLSRDWQFVLHTPTNQLFAARIEADGSVHQMGPIPPDVVEEMLVQFPDVELPPSYVRRS